MAGGDDEPTPEHAPLGIDGQIGCPAQEVAGQEELDAPMLQPLVRRQVLALRVGVDRHLGGFASADRRDEVEGNQAPLALRQLERGVGHVNLHVTTLLHLATPQASTTFRLFTN